MLLIQSKSLSVENLFKTHFILKAESKRKPILWDRISVPMVINHTNTNRTRTVVGTAVG